MQLPNQRLQGTRGSSDFLLCQHLFRAPLNRATLGVIGQIMHTATPIDSWTSLAALIEECAADKWVFRGEASDRYVLQAKAGRVGEQRGSARKVPYDVEHEREALALFKRQARPYLGHTPSSDLEWLAIAQHHGMPTRLLDWTESMLVAAYFAVVQAGVPGNGVIYGVRRLRDIPGDDESRPFEIQNPGIYRPPHITPRIPAQRSVFTVHPDPTEVYEPPGLKRWVISSQACGSIKRILDACAINESSLFPDLHGLSRYLGWR